MKDSREIITTKTTETTHELERPFEPPYAVNGNGNYPMYRGAVTQEGFQLLDYCAPSASVSGWCWASPC